MQMQMSIVSPELPANVLGQRAVGEREAASGVRERAVNLHQNFYS